MNRGDMVAVLVAGGRSSRMGRPKALLEWGNRPLITHQVESLKGFREVIVVLGHDPGPIRPFIPGGSRVRVLENAHYDRGRTSSLLCGFAAVGRPPAGILVVAVDQPLIPEVLAALVRAYHPAAPFAVPTYHGRTGHPVLFRGDLLPELLAITEEGQGLRSVTARHLPLRQCVEVLTPDIFLDLNLPADYDGRLATGPLSL